MIIALLVVTGLAVGLLSSFFGVGGGVLIVPILYSLFPEAPPQMVIATSLGMIFINTVINLTNFYRLGKLPDWRFVIWLGMGLAFGVIIGGSSTTLFSPQVLKYIFASLLLVIGIKSIFSKKFHKNDNPNWKWQHSKLVLAKVTIFSVLGGILSGMTGVGGGAIMIPIFISVVRMPARWLSSYSNAGMFFATASGMITYMLQTPLKCEIGIFTPWQVGQVNWGIIVCLASGALFSSRLGTYLTDIVPASLNKWLFGSLLLVLSIKLFLTA